MTSALQRQQPSNFYAGHIQSEQGIVEVTANDSGVTAIAFVSAPTANAQHNAIVQEACKQLNGYFSGTLTQFDLPLAAKGTPFQHQVWQALGEIKYGDTASYADIANAIGNPKAVRAVGMANGKNPIAIVVPCHRVIGSNNTLTGYAGGLSRKQFLLNLEGAQGVLWQ
ncbi:MAG TPA: cysteine methyltransferase [Alteromonas australica]|uniref:Methylated-DNA--protein-cysteine methyltransferase n=1 Tax=Alteromonas australica TaxID=589873 RepID=A0A350P8D3_9ALTE|nr:methylated-DNA--[protein]-cysteine S-methyltransferase [Alteromonas australica]MBU32380.1 cysteine methyltransferase [Alteromonas sp.]HAW77550.1 cysteine methyltransferase [Alteromonas australica]HBU53000.1 cysteine methyltransferase [Alteromonas australica]|tara:strand:+ start:4939 stop:5442 length:504 start_codon:yes stop_codon:yes gene_type:complete